MSYAIGLLVYISLGLLCILLKPFVILSYWYSMKS